MDAPRLILASTSRYRAELLSRLGVPFEAIAPDYVEDDRPAAGSGAQGPERLVQVQARGKAESIAGAGAIIIGSDQVAEIDGEVLTKPLTRERAIRQLERLAGREHRLLTAVCVVSDRGVAEHLDITRLTVRALTRAEIEHYIDREQPLDCAGSYKFESLGIALFESQDGPDPTAIQGLPLMATCRLLREAGLDVLA